MGCVVIFVRTMSNVFFDVRGLSLAILILAATGHADLHANIAGSRPAVSGQGRLGRDLVRRENRDAASSICERQVSI